MPLTTEKKIQQAMEGASKAALQVLDVVPMQEPWTREQIVAELRRSGKNVSVSVIHGCLDNLRGRGLITEPKSGVFIRVKAKARQSNTTDDETEEPMPPISQPAPALFTTIGTVDPVAKLAAIAGFLRALAGDIEDTALEVQQSMDDIKADGEKLRKLRELLQVVS